MKKILKIFSIFLVVMLLVVTTISIATEEDIMPISMDYFDDYGFVDSDLFLQEDNITLEKKVNGNVYAMGDTIKIASPEINGNIFAIAGTKIEINGKINGSVYVISENLELQGTMNDVYAISSNVTLGEEASIRDFKVISENTIIDGVVNRNAYVLGENVNIGESYSAKVDGTLYTSAEILGSTANINSIEKIEKEEKEIISDEEMEKIGTGILNVFNLIFFYSTEVIGLVIISIIVMFTAKDKMHDNEFKTNIFMDLVYGLLYFVGGWGIVVALMLTVIGIPVAFILGLLLVLVCWKITIPVATIEISKMLFKEGNKSKFFVAIVAFLIFTAVNIIAFNPTIGSLVKNLVSLYGLGHLGRNLFGKRKEEVVEILQ